MAQPLRSLPPQIKNAPLVVPTRRVKFVRVEVIKASLLIRITTVHYIIGAAWSHVCSLGSGPDILMTIDHVRFAPECVAKLGQRPVHLRKWAISESEMAVS